MVIVVGVREMVVVGEGEVKVMVEMKNAQKVKDARVMERVVRRVVIVEGNRFGKVIGEHVSRI